MILSLSALAPFFVAQVVAHGYIKQYSVNGGQSSTAQKTNIQQSAFRSVPSNTGWIGSNFLSSSCLVCGCENTPFGQVASPGGTNFADASQSAGLTPSLPAGKSVQLLVAGNPGQGWPHPTGHLQVYLGKCADDTSCSNFDASTAEYFKILSIPNGVPALRAAYDRSRDGNPWNIQIPESVPTGAYILRAEILAYGQSSSAEGGQVQLYPFCGQIAVTGGGAGSNSTNSTSSARSLASIQTVKFPDVYAKDAQIASGGINHVPGPEVASIFGGNSTFSGGSIDGLEPTDSTLGDTAGESGESSSSGGMSSGGGDAGGLTSSTGSVGSSSDGAGSGAGESSSGYGSSDEGEESNSSPSKTTEQEGGKGKKGCKGKGKNKPPKPGNQLVPITPGGAQISSHKRHLERRARRRQHAQQRAKRAETIFT